MAKMPSINIHYPYRPLETTDHVRLLRIQPGTRAANVVCEVVTHSLESMPEYEALSYSWGRSTDQHHTILIDKISVRIRHNLYQALLDLRKQFKPRTVWVDAICINQSDFSERSSQIHKMGRIYGQAELVTVWTGETSEDSSMAMKFVQEIYAKMVGDGWPASMYKYVMNNFINNPDNDDKWEALTNLCNRPYWTRRWIIQEVALARQCVIQTGKDILDWKAFETVCLEIARPNEFGPDPVKLAAIRQSLALKLAILRSRGQDAYDLQFLLEAFEKSDCKESRDKVYAMFALIESSSSENLVADYEKAMFEVYLDVIRFLVPFYESKTPEGARKLDFAKSIVRISQFVQRNLGDVSANMDEETLEAISASFSISKSMAKGVIFIQGLGGDSVIRLHPYHEALSAELVEKEFENFALFSTGKASSRLATLRNGLDTFDKADMERVVSFDSRISYGTLGLSPARYQPRAEVDLSCDETAPSNRGRGMGIRRRSSLHVRPATEVQVFLGDSGMVGIAPFAAREGDRICHFLNCDAAAVIRPHGSSFLFVGRAFVFRREGCGTPRLNEWTNKKFKYLVPTEEELPVRTHGMSFFADVATLQLLTR